MNISLAMLRNWTVEKIHMWVTRLGLRSYQTDIISQTETHIRGLLGSTHEFWVQYWSTTKTHNCGVLTVFQGCLVAHTLHVVHGKAAIWFLKQKCYKRINSCYSLLTLPYWDSLVCLIARSHPSALHTTVACVVKDNFLSFFVFFYISFLYL